MSFDWSEYLNLAKELAKQSSSPASEEAKLRSAISRAYYAAFCKARNYLRDVKGIQMTGSAQDHQIVAKLFKACSDRNWNKVGVNLERLRIDRNKVDYDDSISGLQSMSKVDLALAQQIIAILNRL